MVETSDYHRGNTHRLTGVWFAVVPIVLIGVLLRAALVFQSSLGIHDALPLVGAFVIGIATDLIYASYAIIPLAIYVALVPQFIFRHRAHAAFMFVVFAMIWWSALIAGAADWLFWEEFGVRPNFIAVDYLIYTTEVIDNIVESYPIAAILAALAAIAVGATYVTTTRISHYKNWLAATTAWRGRLLTLSGILLLPIGASIFLSASDLPEFENRYISEIAKNGQYSFFAAFRNNELDYRKFYLLASEQEIKARMRTLLFEDDALFVAGQPNPIRRHIRGRQNEQNPNVIQITVESLSANFLGAFGNADGLTPNLDRLAEDSLLFTHFMATGTRTVRGMESLSLSVPPTPGRSIVKRPTNDGLFNIGSVFREKGYDTSFIYGGRGYFDNMNAFFSANGFSVHDQNSEPADDIEFSNAWGVSDEDLYKWVLREADIAFESRRPFYQFVMTTSNHRPYTYPEGRIDIPPHTGRAGAVKYTDYAIGQFLKAAQSKPWFSNTVFVIVADHCANSAGKTSIPVNNYRIPLLVYAPGLVQPQRVDTLSSQIDYAPTLFALLGWSYESEFYGKNILDMNENEGRALVATYQVLGLLRNESLTALKPFAEIEEYHVDPLSGAQTKQRVSAANRLDTVAYYQLAADQYDSYLQARLDGG